MNRSLFLLPVLCLCLMVSGSVRAEPAAMLTAQADPVQPAGLPVIVHLTVKNTGGEPFEYTSGGPGRYPGAQLFSATLKSASGRGYRSQLWWDASPVYPYTSTNMPPGDRIELYNGQYWSALAACISVPINPGDTVDVPLALSPLPPGRYTLTFDSKEVIFAPPGKRVVEWPGMAAAPISVVVVRDPVLAQAEADALRQRARANEPFARSVCSYFSIPR